MTKNKLFIPLAFFSLVLSACSQSAVADYKYMKDVEAPHFIEISYQEFMNEIKDQKLSRQADIINSFTSDDKNKGESKKENSCIVYFGFPGCPWCEEAVPILTEHLKVSHLYRR